MNSTRRTFFKQLVGLGLFTILPGAGRVWKAERKVDAICGAWSEEQLALYNKLPYFMGQQQALFTAACDSAWKRLLAQGKFPSGLVETTRVVNW